MTETIPQQHCYSIQSIPLDERPRERLLRHGAEFMTSAELIAIVLGSGMKGIPILQLAQDIMARFGSLEGLAKATIPELCTIKGLGPAKALQLKAAVSLGLRASRKHVPEKLRISSPTQAYLIVKEILENKSSEHFAVMLLDVKNCLIHQQIVTIGTLSETIIHPREVYNIAVRYCAANIIMVHNHPSGDPTPSKEDYEVTTQFIDAGKIMGIPIKDHLIIGNNSFNSLRQLGVAFP